VTEGFFSRGSQSGEFSFYQFKIRRKAFSQENITGKYHISKSRGRPLCHPFRRP